MTQPVRAFVLKRIRHLILLILWGVGMVVGMKIVASALASFGGSDFEIRFDSSDRNAWLAFGIAVVGIWIGMTVLEFFEFRKNEQNGSSPSGSGEEM